MLAINKCKNFYTLKLQLSTSRFTALAATNITNIKITITHIIKPNKQAASPHIHNVGHAFLLSRVMKEIITPTNESIGPAIITSVYVYGA